MRVLSMVSPVDEAIATSEIAEDSNIVAEGHQDNQYGNWSGAAEGVVATTTDTAMGIIDEMLDIPTEVMPALKKAVTPRAVLNSELLPIVLGVGVVTGLVSSAAVSIITFAETFGGFQKTVGVVSSFVLGSALVYLGLGASSDFYKYALFHLVQVWQAHLFVVSYPSSLELDSVLKQLPSVLQVEADTFPQDNLTIKLIPVHLLSTLR